MKDKKFGMAYKILIALVLGIIIGTLIHNNDYYKELLLGSFLQPAGKIFILLIKMIVIPIVISTLIVGIAGVGDAKKFGRIGVKTIIYFEIVTTAAIFIGLLIANLFHPGSGIDISALHSVDISSYEKTTAEVGSAEHGIITTILSLIPSNIFDAMAKGNILTVIFFSVLFGLGLSALPDENKKPLQDVFKSISAVMFKVTNMVMSYAPIGVFALIASSVATFGFASVVPLLKLVITVYLSIIFFAIVVLGTIAKTCKINIFKLMAILKDELILAYSTASSETVLPRIMEKMEQYGVSKSIAGFVIPTGYSFNLDGSTLYQSIAAIFIAQLYHIDLTIGQQIILVLTLMITSKGVAGVPGASFVVLLATLGSVGIPLEGLAFIAGIDRILDMARTALNVVGNALAALVIAKWENDFNSERSLAYEEKFFNRSVRSLS